MVSLQERQCLWIERLRTKADPRDTGRTQNADPLGVQVDRVGLKAQLAAACERKRLSDQLHQAGQFTRRQMCGCAAAKEQGVNFVWTAAPCELACQRFEIAAD